MEQRRIGSLEVSVVGLGCNNFGMRIDYARSEAVVHAALDAGITLFDTADIYGGTHSEEFLGRALGARRHDVVVATKFGMRVDDARRGAKPAYVRQALDDSLRRLGMDAIDLYQLHEPDPDGPHRRHPWRPQRPGPRRKGARDRLLEFLGRTVARGRSRRRRRAPQRFVSVQNEYSLVHREPELEVLPECERLGLAFIPFFPLASGLLTGKYQRGAPPPEGTRLSQSWAASRFLSDERLTLVDALRRFAESRGHSILELAMSWTAHRPVVASVIAGATTPEQVRANAQAAAWKLTESDLAEIDRIAPVAIS